MTNEQFNENRRDDESLDLLHLYRSEFGASLSLAGREFLSTIEEIHPIRSRQIAALALATAHHLKP